MSMQILKSICTPPGDLRCPGDRLQYNFERYFGSRRNPVLYPIGTWPSKFSRECMIEWEEHIRGCKHSATNTVLPDTTTSRERWGRPDRNTGSEMDPAQQSMLVEEFRSVTSSSHETARELLQITDFNLDQAIDLFFSDAGRAAGPLMSNEALAHQIHNGSTGGSGVSGRVPDLRDSPVRAPIPVKRDRLYGEADEFALAYMRAGMRQQTRETGAFNDFEYDEHLCSGRESPPRERGRPLSLGEMFKAPKGIMFQGNFEAAKEKALERSMWLLVNLQANKEFASHQLNRDTWGDVTLQDILKGSFIFLQVMDSTDEGQKVQNYYKLYELPAIVVIDPITGSAMRTFTGFVQAERLVEELVPFMDHNPEAPQGQRLGAAQHKRKFMQTSAAKPKAPTEEEELEMALTMSMVDSQLPLEPAAVDRQPPAEKGPSSTAAVDQLREGADASTTQVVPQRAPQEVQAEAAASLAPEPDPSDPAGCRVAVRLPGGSRVARRFLKSAPLEVLHTFCLASSPEAAGGRAFSLVQAVPGAPLLSDLKHSLEAAGIANALVSMAWS